MTHKARIALPLAVSLTALIAACVPAQERPAPPRTQSTPSWGSRATTVYVVRPGDTLSEIAQSLGVDMDALARANGIAPPYLIRIGQHLRIPSRQLAYTPRRAPTPAPAPTPTPPAPAPAAPPVPPPPPSRLPVPTATASPAPPPMLPQSREADAPRLTWPTDGALTSHFGDLVDGLPNNGIDLAAYPGMAVRSAAAGTVIFAGKEDERFGNTVIVDHGGGWVTVYAYLGRLTVTVGESVRQRTRIAFVGKSGEARHPGVHFELRRNNVPRNPELYLPPRL